MNEEAKVRQAALKLAKTMLSGKETSVDSLALVCAHTTAQRAKQASSKLGEI
jgi:hypothetical protein